MRLMVLSNFPMSNLSWRLYISSCFCFMDIAKYHKYNIPKNTEFKQQMIWFYSNILLVSKEGLAFPILKVWKQSLPCVCSLFQLNQFSKLNIKITCCSCCSHFPDCSSSGVKLFPNVLCIKVLLFYQECCPEQLENKSVVTVTSSQ